MSALSSLRVRLLVLFGLLAILLAGAASVFLARAQHQAAAPVVTTPATAKTAKTATTAATQPGHARAVHPAKKPAVRTHVAAKGPAGVPLVLHRALESHAVVVVSVVVGHSAADDAALREARAGAASAGAGFLRIDVGRRRLAKAFATMLGGDTLTPATLFVQRPGLVFVRLDGYADRLVVGQAAANARKRS